MDDSEFLKGLKRPEDRQQEWTDSAEAFVRLRRPPPEQEKTAGKVRSQSLVPPAPKPTKKKPLVIQGQEKAAAGGTADFVKKHLTSRFGGAIDVLKNPKSYAYIVPPMLATGAATYVGSKPREGLEGKSLIENSLDNAVAKQKQEGEEGAGFFKKTKNRGMEFGAGMAKTMREHPVKASLLAALTAPTGLRLGMSTAAKKHGLGGGGAIDKILDKGRT